MAVRLKPLSVQRSKLDYFLYCIKICELRLKICEIQYCLGYSVLCKLEVMVTQNFIVVIPISNTDFKQSILYITVFPKLFS
jgi:hypothetical protein